MGKAYIPNWGGGMRLDPRQPGKGHKGSSKLGTEKHPPPPHYLATGHTSKTSAYVGNTNILPIVLELYSEEATIHKFFLSLSLIFFKKIRLITQMSGGGPRLTPSDLPSG